MTSIVLGRQVTATEAHTEKLVDKIASKLAPQTPPHKRRVIIFTKLMAIGVRHAELYAKLEAEASQKATGQRLRPVLAAIPGGSLFIRS